jgi:hypothetical protein
VKGQVSQDLLGSEGPGIFLFVQQFDPAHPNAVVIEVELFGVIDGMADLDTLTDIGGGDLVERTFEANGGVVIDHSFVADEKDFIQLLSGQPADQHSPYGSMITVDGSFLDTGVEFMVIIVFEPKSEGFIEFFQGQTLLESREEPFSYSPKEAFHLPAGRAIIRFGVDEGDPGLGTASSQEIGGERRTIIAIKPLWDSIGQEGLLEDDG